MRSNLLSKLVAAIDGAILRRTHPSDCALYRSHYEAPTWWSKLAAAVAWCEAEADKRCVLASASDTRRCRVLAAAATTRCDVDADSMCVLVSASGKRRWRVLAAAATTHLH